jgi:hypothetical protein
MAASRIQHLDGSFPAAYSNWGPSCHDPSETVAILESSHSRACSNVAGNSIIFGTLSASTASTTSRSAGCRL